MLVIKCRKEVLEVLGFNSDFIGINLPLNSCRKGNYRVILEMMNQIMYAIEMEFKKVKNVQQD